ncbi:membrane protein [Streptomyces olindensis]|nr:membrane protein [Streptomyces olindensis]
MNADSRRVTHGPARRLAVPAGLLAGAVAAFAYVGAVDPNEPGHYPVCPLLHYTGLYCPGCGGLRSAHAFVHGDLPAALHANALAVLGYLAFAVLWTVWVVHAVRGRPLRIDPRPGLVWGLGALLLVFTVVRNLPFGGWLHP